MIGVSCVSQSLEGLRQSEVKEFQNEKRWEGRGSKRSLWARKKRKVKYNNYGSERAEAFGKNLIEI